MSNRNIPKHHIKMIATMFTSRNPSGRNPHQSTLKVQLVTELPELPDLPTDLPLAGQSLTSMLRAKCWRMPWHVGPRSSKGWDDATVEIVEYMEMVRCVGKVWKSEKNHRCSLDIAIYCTILYYIAISTTQKV